MSDQKDNFNLDKNVFDDNNQERKLKNCWGQSCSRSLIVFFSQIFVILLLIFDCFRRIPLSKTCCESTVRVGLLFDVADYFYRHQDFKQGNFYKNWVYISKFGPSKAENHNSFLQMAQQWNF